jgi:hypothetical protein
MQRFPRQQGVVINISKSLVYPWKRDPFLSLVALGKKKMFLAIQTRNRSLNVSATFGWRIVFEEAMRKTIEESRQRKHGNEK